MARLLFAILVSLMSGAGSMPAAAAPGSAGCGTPAPPDPPVRVSVDGASRSMITAVPDGYDPDVPHGLVVAFHGRTNPAERVRRYYGLEAGRERTIFVYPRARRQEDGTFVWRLPGDVALFDAVVAAVSKAYCIAPDEVFAVGHSLGATFVNTLACLRGAVLRGIGTVAGGIGGIAPAECTGRTAAMLLHHPDDRLVPIELGRAARDVLLARNGLPGDPDAVDPGFPGCHRHGEREADPVLWCPHDRARTGRRPGQGRYYPHQWPRGTGGIFMDFFEALD